MEGLLLHPPTQAELERLYFELARVGAPSVGRRRPWPYHPKGHESLLALAGEMIRYDPRLLSILLQLVIERWEDLNPLALRRSMDAMRWPQALLVVFEFARVATDEPELKHLANYVAAGRQPLMPAERFFLDVERPGSRMSRRKLGRNLKPYARWGFVASERPTADARTKRVVGRYDARTRRRILDDLLAKQEKLSVRDYLDAIDHSVSRQQAAADLRAHPNLARVGRGRGTYWRRTLE